MTNTLQLGILVLIAQALTGCGAEDGRSSLPSAPSPVETLPPPVVPTPQRAVANGVLSGVINEVTASGRIPLEGATVYLLTCGTWNCPDAVDYTVKTDKDGRYRIAGVFNGELNFFWVRDELYALVNPMAPGTCPDDCDRVITVNGDTKLNVDLVRR
jgi:hypothetical protein